MRVLKIITEGLVTSFRYPHFVQGVHLSFEMPPPATIYGHICSAVGEMIPPEATRFAYFFAFQGKFFDYEHLHFFGKEPKMNPFRRELLFEPRLTLYLDNLDLLPYFQSPAYPVALGRSQDLMTYVDVREVELEQAERTFFAGTLLPLRDAALIGGRTYAVTMPQYIDVNRQATWGQYAVLSDRVIYPSEESFVASGGAALPIWVDPEADARHPYEPLQRGVIWLDWVTVQNAYHTA